MCLCGKESKTILQYLLRCDLYSIYRLELHNDICTLNESLQNFLEQNFLKILLCGEEDFTSHMTCEFIKKDRSL